MGNEFSSPFYLFENTKESSASDSFCFTDPAYTISASNFSEVEPCYKKIQTLSRQGYFLAGYVAYEAGLTVSKAQAKSSSQLPLVHFHAFEKKSKIELDLDTQENFNLFEFERDLEFKEYLKAFEIVQRHLSRGDTYQVNLSLREYFRGPENAFALYKVLRNLQRVDYACFISLEDVDILSLSPELFLKKQKDILYSLPMKGTSGKNSNSSNLYLDRDPKSLAENIMIVDLIRNDMSQIAKRGSVKAENLCYIEEYETLNQMISEVRCEIDPTSGITEIFKALFPCGSITGAPKNSTMNIIQNIEKTDRGLYTGAIGYIEPGGDFTFSVAIRTIVGNKKGAYEIGLGSGVLAESDPKEEHDEIWLKSKFIKSINSNFYLFETLRVEAGELKNLNLHILRLEKSANYFGFYFDRVNTYSELEKISIASGIRRCRLVLRFDGAIEIEIEDFREQDGNRVISVSTQKLNSSNIFLKHKTSKRDFYNLAYENAQKEGFYDVVFLNEQGQLCEASRHNIFLKHKGIWTTPQLNSGLLPGIQRGISLASLGAIEKDLFLDDLENAEEIILTNSLRGEVQVNLNKN